MCFADKVIKITLFCYNLFFEILSKKHKKIQNEKIKNKINREATLTRGKTGCNTMVHILHICIVST